MTSPGSYEFVNIAIASKFNPREGSHTSDALFNIIINGAVVGQINNTMTVKKGGSRGHYWGYQTTAVTQKMYRYPVRQGDIIRVVFISGNQHNSSSIQLSLSN